MYIQYDDGEYHIYTNNEEKIGIISDADNIDVARNKLGDILIDKVKDKGDYGDFLLSQLLR